MEPCGIDLNGEEQHKRYGSRGNYVSMQSSYFANFERSWAEVRTKLARSWAEVGSKFVRSGQSAIYRELWLHSASTNGRGLLLMLSGHTRSSFTALPKIVETLHFQVRNSLD